MCSVLMFRLHCVLYGLYKTWLFLFTLQTIHWAFYSLSTSIENMSMFKGVFKGVKSPLDSNYLQPYCFNHEKIWTLTPNSQTASPTGNTSARSGGRNGGIAELASSDPIVSLFERVCQLVQYSGFFPREIPSLTNEMS